MSINVFAPGKIVNASRSSYKVLLGNEVIEIHGATYYYDKSNDLLIREDLHKCPIIQSNKKGQKELF